MSSSEKAATTKAKAIMEALRRIVDGRPWQMENKEEAAAGKLRVTFTTVAREAGVSRGLISREATAYQKERAAVLKAMGRDEDAPAPKTTATALVQSLRGDKQELERHVRVLATRVHDACLENDELRKKVSNLETELADANEALHRATVRQFTRA